MGLFSRLLRRKDEWHWQNSTNVPPSFAVSGHGVLFAPLGECIVAHGVDGTLQVDCEVGAAKTRAVTPGATRAPIPTAGASAAPATIRARHSPRTSRRSWTQGSSAGTPTAPVDHGTFGRFRYVRRTNVFVLVNGVDDDVWFYKHTAGCGP